MKQILIDGSLSASRLALGCMRITRVPREDSDRLIKTALDLGIDYFDHADVYAAGESERLFGQILDLKGSVREKIKIQSKCTLVRDANETLYNDSTKEYLLHSVDKVLSRLNTDYLDAFLLHAADTLVEPEEVGEAFEILLANGKVRHFGVSNHKPLQIELLQKYSKVKLAICQMQLSAAYTDLIDSSGSFRLMPDAAKEKNGDILTWCRLNDVTIQAWSPFQFGFYGGIFLGNENYPRLNGVINRLAEEKGVSPSVISVAWILRHPAIIQPLIGTTNADRLRDIAHAVDIEITRAEWYEIYKASLNDEGKFQVGNSNKQVSGKK